MHPDDRDERMPANGNKLTVLELVHAMIRRSSNEATNLLVEMVGLPAAASIWTTGGGAGCRMERLIGDVAAQANGATNEATPYGLARLLHGIVTGHLTSPGSAGVLIDTLMGQEFPCIAEVLPKGTAWGSKSGWVEGTELDVAFLGSPLGGHVKVLAICTEGFQGRQARPEIQRTAISLLGWNVKH